jgi:hypothetical protein
MTDIVDQLRFDAIRCEAQFSKEVAGNIDAAADEIEQLRRDLSHAKAVTEVWMRRARRSEAVSSVNGDVA